MRARDTHNALISSERLTVRGASVSSELVRAWRPAFAGLISLKGPLLILV